MNLAETQAIGRIKVARLVFATNFRIRSARFDDFHWSVCDTRLLIWKNWYFRTKAGVEGTFTTGSTSQNCLRTSPVAKKLANDPSVLAASRSTYLKAHKQ